MKTSTKYLGTFALAATLIASLAGCVATTPAAAPKPTHSSTAVATPKPTTAPVAAAPTAETVTVGQELTADEALALRKNYNDLITAGKVLYTTADGKSVVVGMKEPLPPVVSVDAAAKAAVAVKVSASESDATNAAVVNSVKALESSTGKKVVLVAYVQAANDARDALVWRWIAIVPTESAHFFGSQAAGIAWGQSFIAGQANPAGWAVIS